MKRWYFLTLILLCLYFTALGQRSEFILKKIYSVKEYYFLTFTSVKEKKDIKVASTTSCIPDDSLEELSLGKTYFLTLSPVSYLTFDGSNETLERGLICDSELVLKYGEILYKAKEIPCRNFYKPH